MRKLIGLFALLALLGAQTVFAQGREVTGTVVDRGDRQPMPGVSVVVKGSPATGTATDLNGSFKLRVNDADVLVFTFVGMKTQEVSVAGKTHLNVEMEPASEKLEEVIVVGYGTIKREAKTGSIASVDAEELADIPATSVDKMLSGKMAGVQITQSSGQPGSSTSIRIRGTSSINAGNNPLYVVDGVPVSSGDDAIMVNTSNVIAAINPSDIENITVLKDAAAASVYGSRAANGVILITTKSGREGKNVFTARAKFGLSWLANDNDYGVMDGKQLLEFQREAIRNAGKDPDDPTGGATYYRPYELLSRPQTNWMDHFTRYGKMQEYEITMSGGSSRTKYYNSLSYHKNEGIYYGVDYKRIQTRINVDHEINKHLSTGVRLNLSYNKSQDIPMQSLYYSNPAFAGLTILPWTPRYDENGNFNCSIPENSDTNPRATAKYDEQWQKTYGINGSMYLQYKPIKQLTLRTTNAIEMRFAESWRYWANEAHNWSAGYPKLQTDEVQDRTITTSNTITFEDMYGKHSVRLLAGQEANHSYSWEEYQMSEDLNPKIPYHNSGNPEKFSVDYGRGTTTLASFFGILDYNFDSRYYLQASVRYDGSSLFGENERWGTFWSVGASWNAHNEAFLKNLAWLDLGKVRFSYGTSGNNNISNYMSYGTYSSVAYNGVTGLAPSAPANPDLSWEQNESLNVGLDFRVFKRFSGSIDYYTRKTKDMLLAKSQSSTSGFNSATQNVGSVRNSGIEVQLDADIFTEGAWKWSVGFNIAHNQSKILELAGEPMLSYSDNRLRHIVGEKLLTFYLNDYAGVNPVNGDALWRTESGELTNDYGKSRYVKAGSPEPTYTGGVNTSVSWKGINLSVVGEFKGGNKVLIVENRYLQSDGNQMSMNHAKSALNYWKKPGDTKCNPKPVAGNSSNSYTFANTRFLEKGDYFRIKDITLSYSLPKNWMNRIHFASARVYASALNIYTFHDVNFWDPERGVSGMGIGVYPVSKTFVGGLELTF